MDPNIPQDQNGGSLYGLEYGDLTEILGLGLDNTYAQMQPQFVNNLPQNNSVQMFQPYTTNSNVKSESPFQYCDQPSNFENGDLPTIPSVKPVLLLNLKPNPGLHKFSTSVPETQTKNKWFYSKIIKRIYTGKDVAFPVQITVAKGFRGSILFHPVYSSTDNRNLAVKRCPNCRTIDPNDPHPSHVFRVEGGQLLYFKNNSNHNVIQMPVMQQPLDEETFMVHMRMVCRTSCPGGPNRRMFVILAVLMDQYNNEVGRDVIDVKCCESASRDMNTDEKKRLKEVDKLEPKEEIAMIASGLTIKKQKKRKLIEPNKDDFVEVMVPRRHEAKIREHLELLLIKDSYDKQHTKTD